MEIIVEDHKIEIDLPKRSVLLKEIVDEVEQFLFSAGKIPVGLKIDGHSLSQEEFDERSLKEVKGTEVLNFDVVGILDFILENIEGAQAANTSLIDNLKTFALEIHDEKKTVQAEQVKEELSHFFDFWLKLHHFLPDDFNTLKYQGVDFDPFMGKLKQLFEETVAAMEANDFVLAADLLQYEIVAAIEAVNQIIPELKAKILERKEHSEKASFS